MGMVEAIFNGQVIARSDRTRVVERKRGRNVACTYRHPSPLARRIKSRVAFWGAVEVTDGARREAR